MDGRREERTIGKKLEAAGGFEPPNRGFADRSLNHLGMPPHDLLQDLKTKKGDQGLVTLPKPGYPGAFGAGDGVRTRDFNLGKVALYH